MCKELTIVIRWLSNKILLVFLWPHLVWAFRPSAHHPLRTHKEISKMLLAYQLLSSSALSCGHFSSATQIIRASKVDKDGFCSGYLCIVFVVQSLTHVWLFETLWTTACQILLAWTIFQCLLRFMSIESVMLSNHLILYHPLLLLPSLFPRIRVFSDESALHIRWPKYWSFSFSISPSNEYSRLVSFRIGWCDLLAVQGTLKSLL